MKKNVFVCCLVIPLFFLGCNNHISVYGNKVHVADGEVSLDYHNKDLSQDFLSFLESPVKSTANFRSADADDELDETDYFAMIWDSLSEEEKNDVMQNLDSLQMEGVMSIATEVDTPAGRAAANNENVDMETLGVLLSFKEKLKDWIGDTKIPSNLTTEIANLMSFNEIEFVSSIGIIELLIANNDWDSIDSVLAYLNYPIELKDIKKNYEEVEKILSLQSEHAERSASKNFRAGPAVTDLGKKLKDGSVLLTVDGSSAYFIVGDWAHAGIFSKKAYEKNGLKDTAFCVYTAQPEKAADYPDGLRPDRPGYTCFDTVAHYTYQRKVAVILPKNYDGDKAATAVNTAKTVFYDPKAAYNLPWWEIAFLGDTSHNGTNEFSYCSKVAYTSWKKAGSDLDGNTFAGFLVTPDDIYSSSYNHYFTFTLKILWWTKTWEIQTYTATSNVEQEYHQ